MNKNNKIETAQYRRDWCVLSFSLLIASFFHTDPVQASRFAPTYARTAPSTATVMPVKLAENTPTKNKKTKLKTTNSGSPIVYAAKTMPIYYGQGLCVHTAEYNCIKIGHGDNWASLFPDEAQRDLVQRINRKYNPLWLGQIIAVPVNLAKVTLLDLAPFPHAIDDHEKQVIVDQDKLAWAAYDAQGNLVKWGPIASGSDKCSDSANSCRTLTGVYRVFSKENENCKSDVYPLNKGGGAKMPYCMYFHKGFALHGSDDMPGYRASHGCVRMFIADAKWLNETFVESSNAQNNNMGTKVVIRPVASTTESIL